LVRDYCRHRRDTLELSDEQFLRSGIQRVLGQCDSGRDFLQARQDGGEHLARSTWFDALHSKRRGAMVAEVARRSYEVYADRGRRRYLMEGSFAHATNRYHFKRARWRRLWRQRIQDWIIAVVQNIALLCGPQASHVAAKLPRRPSSGAVQRLLGSSPAQRGAQDEVWRSQRPRFSGRWRRSRNENPATAELVIELWFEQQALKP
jgi:hypothetical protein